MLKTIVNEVRFPLTLTARGPLLIRSGQATAHGPDMTPVRTFRNGRREVYIPGSSLKGAVRAQAERIIRTMRPDLPGLVCDPFLTPQRWEPRGPRPYTEVSCGGRFQRRKDAGQPITPPVAYADSCPVCRLFGNTELMGRVHLNDAYLPGPPWEPTEVRDGVGIDRYTGGPAHQVKFDLEAVSSGTVFETEVLLRNIECWQLGLLLSVLQDMHDGLVPMGGGRARGFGDIDARVARLTLYQARGLDAPGTAFQGLGRALSALNDYGYGTQPDDMLQMPLTWSERGVRLTTELAGQASGSVSESTEFGALRAAAVEQLRQRIKVWTPPAEMAEPPRRAAAGAAQR